MAGRTGPLGAEGTASASRSTKRGNAGSTHRCVISGPTMITAPVQLSYGTQPGYHSPVLGDFGDGPIP